MDLVNKQNDLWFTAKIQALEDDTAIGYKSLNSHLYVHAMKHRVNLLENQKLKGEYVVV